MPGGTSSKPTAARIAQRAAHDGMRHAGSVEERATEPDPELQGLLSAPPGQPGHDEEARLFERFFSWPPPPPMDGPEITFERPRMSAESKRAMWASLLMFSVSAVVIGGYAAYYRVVMPAPAELGADEELVLPTPTAAADTGASGVEPGVEVESSFDGLLALARQQAGVGDDAQALSAFDRALRLRPYSADALAGRAASLLRLKDYESAKATAEQAVAITPRNAEGLWVLAASQRQLGDESAAEATYERCVQEAAGSYVDECRRGLAADAARTSRAEAAK